MRTIFDLSARDEVLARLERLRPDAHARWGQLDAPRMLCHVADQLRQGLGELEAQPIRSPLAVTPVNWLVIHVLPWPKGRGKSPPEFLQRQPNTWNADLRECRRLINAFFSRGPRAAWPSSPVFGRISGRSWGVLAYKHLDHHLRQFGA